MQSISSRNILSILEIVGNVEIHLSFMASKLIRYARHHGVAIDHHSLDLDDICQTAVEELRSERNDKEDRNSLALLTDWLPGQDEISDLVTERLTITQDESRILQDALKTANPFVDMSSINWHLPDWEYPERLKVKLPLLMIGGGDTTKDTKSVKRGVDIDGMLTEIRYDKQKESSKAIIAKEAELFRLRLTSHAQDFGNKLKQEKVIIDNSSLSHLRSALVAIPIQVQDYHLPKCQMEDFVYNKLRDDDECTVEEPFKSVSKQYHQGRYDQLSLCSASKKPMQTCLSVEVDQDVYLRSPHDTDVDLDKRHHLNDPIFATNYNPHQSDLDGEEVQDCVSSSTIGALTLTSQPYELMSGPDVDGTTHTEIQDPFSLVDIDFYQFIDWDIDETTDSAMMTQEKFNGTGMATTPSNISSGKTQVTSDLNNRPQPQIGIHESIHGKAVQTTLPRIFRDRSIANSTVLDDILSVDKVESTVDHEKSFQLLEELNDAEGKDPRMTGLPNCTKTESESVFSGIDHYCQERKLTPSNSASSTRYEVSMTSDRREKEAIDCPQTAYDKILTCTTTESINLESCAEPDGYKSYCKGDSHHPVPTSRNIWPENEVGQSKLTGANTKSSDHYLSTSIKSTMSAFLDLRGQKFKKESQMSNHIATEIVDDPIESTQSSYFSEKHQDFDSSTNNAILFNTVSHNGDVSGLSSSSSPLEKLPKPWTILLNSDLLNTRPRLVSFLERQTEQDELSIIYQDFDKTIDTSSPDMILDPVPNSSLDTNPTSNMKSNSASNSEVNLKPKSYIYITSLQNLTQRSLPGHSSDINKDTNFNLSQTHTRIQNLHKTFKDIKVIILEYVLPSMSLSSRNFSEMDQSTNPTHNMKVINEFTRFCQILISSSSESSSSISRMKSTKPSITPIHIQYVSSSDLVHRLNSYVWSEILHVAGNRKSSNSKNAEEDMNMKMKSKSDLQ